MERMGAITGAYVQDKCLQQIGALVVFQLQRLLLQPLHLLRLRLRATVRRCHAGTRCPQWQQRKMLCCRVCASSIATCANPCVLGLVAYPEYPMRTSPPPAFVGLGSKRPNCGLGFVSVVPRLPVRTQSERPAATASGARRRRPPTRQGRPSRSRALLYTKTAQTATHPPEPANQLGCNMLCADTE